jgi:SPP1 gp7 family putative phage head morphogenesis protein
MLVAIARVRRRNDDWRLIHRIADRYEPRMKQLMRRAFAAARDTLNRAALAAALRRKDERAVFTLASEAIVRFSNVLHDGDFEKLLRGVLSETGDVAARRLRIQLRIQLRNALRATQDDVEFEFDVTNPNAVKWAREHAAETITGISETTRENIRDLVERAFEEQFDVDRLTDEITDLIGDEDRAETIARTEVMRASNEGQLQAWEQATSAGLLIGTEEKEWIVTPDDRLCPICEPLDGVRVGMRESFDTEVGRLEGPPAHPNCRCVLGLSA